MGHKETEKETHLSGRSTGANRLHMYNSMQTQLDTTRIHMATSERPIYTSESGSTGPEIGVLETTFLLEKGHYRRSRGCGKGDKPVCEQHSNIHGCDGENNVEPGILRGGGL